MTPEAEALVAEVRRGPEAAVAPPARPGDPAWVAAAFAALHRKDQAFRELYAARMQAGDEAGLTELRPVLIAADDENRDWLRAWIDAHGWPLAARYGEDVAQAAWLVALHADRDPAFQRRALEVLEPAFRADRASAVHFAGLHDRLALAEGRPQTYGMFYRLEAGEAVPYPVEDPGGLAARRAELGLGETRFHR